MNSDVTFTTKKVTIVNGPKEFFKITYRTLILQYSVDNWNRRGSFGWARGTNCPSNFLYTKFLINQLRTTFNRAEIIMKIIKAFNYFSFFIFEFFLPIQLSRFPTK